MDASQMFIFILSIVIVGMVLLFGTRAVLNWGDDVSEYEYIRFKASLTDALRDSSSDFGSVRQRTFPFPGQYQKVCLVDLGERPPSDLQVDGIDQPLMRQEWDAETANVFLLSQGVEERFLDERVRVNATGGIICFRAERGQVHIRFEGVGRSSLVSYWSDR